MRKKITWAELSEKTGIPMSRSLTRKDRDALERKKRGRSWGRRRRRLTP